jgi:hypothetical protein
MSRREGAGVLMSAPCGSTRDGKEASMGKAKIAVAGAAAGVRRHVVEAHPTIVFARLAISRWMEATDRLVT